MGLEHNAIKEILQLFCLRYWCLSDEIGKNGTYHTHLFIYSDSPIRFNTIKNRFPVAHIDKSYGTCQENKDYILKQGKWEKTEKSETRVDGTFDEYGECPKGDDEKDPEKVEIIKLIKDGISNIELLEKYPQYAFKLKEIDYLRNSIFENAFEKEFREVESFYLFGEVSNYEKIKYVYKINHNKNICLIPNYEKNITFDNYKGQEILVIEFDFNKISLNTIINFMKGVPIQLPARFSNKQSSFNKLYLITENSIQNNYVKEQGTEPNKWMEFKKGFKKIIEFNVNGKVIDSETGEILEGDKYGKK